MLTKLQATAKDRGIDLDEIKITTGPTRDETGAPIPRPLQTRMLGMSESFAPHSAESVTTRLPESKAGAAGRAVNGIERRVVDPETGQEVAPGEVGELHLRGGALMTGFYKVPATRSSPRTGSSRPRISSGSTPTVTHSSSAGSAT